MKMNLKRTAGMGAGKSDAIFDVVCGVSMRSGAEGAAFGTGTSAYMHDEQHQLTGAKNDSVSG